MIINFNKTLFNKKYNDKIKEAYEYAIKYLKISCSDLEINIDFISKNKIKKINANFRNKDAVTDVISFAFEEHKDIEYEDMRFLGEIYISYERCVSQAKDYGHSVKREFCYLAVHGLLHLLGYDHMTDEDKNKTIEAMMADATNLYNAGKVEEAKSLYDKISEINKTLVKN